MFGVPPPDLFAVEIVNDEKLSILVEIRKLSKNTERLYLIIAKENIIRNTVPVMGNARSYQTEISIVSKKQKTAQHKLRTNKMFANNGRG